MTADYVVHASICYDLGDAREMLEEVMKLFVPNEKVDEDEFNWRMAHLYSHINSAWHKRNLTNEQLKLANSEEMNRWAMFPTDITPM